MFNIVQSGQISVFPSFISYFSFCACTHFLLYDRLPVSQHCFERLQGRTWFRNFRVLGVRQKQSSKTSKTGHFGVLQSKSSDCCLNCEKNNTIRLLRRRIKNDKIHVISIPFNDYHIFSTLIIIRTYRKRQKNISVQCRQCSAILFWNRSRDCSVYTTLEDGVAGVRRYRCSSTTWLLFCLFGVKGVKGTAKSRADLI